jgi:hypothetical protein
MVPDTVAQAAYSNFAIAFLLDLVDAVFITIYSCSSVHLVDRS